MNIQKYQNDLFESFLELKFKYFSLIRYIDNSEYIDDLLPEYKNAINETNIYFICEKPRLQFIYDSLFYDKKILKFEVELWSNNSVNKQQVVIYDYNSYFKNAIGFSLNELNKSKITIYYPYNSSRTLPIESFTQFYYHLFDSTSIANYKVLYIGQSKKNSNALIRTRDHKQLQIILRDTLEYNRHKEIFLLLASIDKPNNILFTDGQFSIKKDNGIKSIKKFQELAKSNQSPEIINLMEALLIKHFKPRYNDKLKNTTIKGTELFIKKYKKYFDINSIAMDIDTSFLPNVQLFSDVQEPSKRHKIRRSIHGIDDRIGIQDILKT